MGKRHNSGFDFPIDARTALTAADMGATFVPGGTGIQAATALASSSFEVQEKYEMIRRLTGKPVATDKEYRQAVKHYAEQSAEAYTDNLVNFAGLTAGAAAGSAAASALTIANPWASMALHLGAPIAAGSIGSYLATELFVAKKADLANFFASCQHAGEAGQFRGEQAFVMGVLNLPKPEMGVMLRCLQTMSGGKIKSIATLVEAADPKSKNHRFLTEAMKEPSIDMNMRAAFGLNPNLDPRDQTSGSEIIAKLVNNGRLQGIQLLDMTEVGMVTSRYNMLMAQHFHASEQPMAASNPNQHLPGKTWNKDLGI